MIVVEPPASCAPPGKTLVVPYDANQDAPDWPIMGAAEAAAAVAEGIRAAIPGLQLKGRGGGSNGVAPMFVT